MLCNRRTLTLAALTILTLSLSAESAQAFTFPQITMPSFTVQAPTMPTTPTSPTIQTQVTTSSSTTTTHITQSTSSATTTTPTATPTPTPTPTSTPTVMKVISPVTTFFPWPTKTITPTPTPASPTPTNTPTPTMSITPSTTQTSSNSLLDDKQQYMLDAINAYRAQNGLYPVKPNKETCDFAAVRAKEIVTDFSHNGFVQRVNTQTLPYMSYSYITENIAETSNYQDVVNMWIASPGHAANMRADTPYVCVAYSGNYYAYEGLNP